MRTQSEKQKIEFDSVAELLRSTEGMEQYVDIIENTDHKIYNIDPNFKDEKN